MRMSTRSLAVLAFFALIGLYNIALDFLPGGDAEPNVFLPISILKHKKLTYSPLEYPFMFDWTTTNSPKKEITGYGWMPNREKWPESIGIKRDGLQLLREHYFIIPSVKSGVYVNNFGLGAGLFALPVFAIASFLVDLESDPNLVWALGKVASSIAVAGSAIFIFFTALRFCNERESITIALSYGLGTCVWSISSQTLWQHGPNEFFLALGCFFFLKKTVSFGDWLMCGLAWSLAVLCRPTSLLVMAITGVWLFFKSRKALLPFIVGGVPVGVLMGVYNWYFLGSPFTFGQTERGHTVALEKTGSVDLWQTPLLEGLTGLLISPSRGLLVFSPFLVFAFFGGAIIWRNASYTIFRPLTISVAGLFIVAAKWFDWWGGWCYGYRPVVDTAPFLAIFLIPVITPILRVSVLNVLFAALLSWSIFVQLNGALNFCMASWNERDKMNIDKIEYRYRLWSWRDNQIMYCLENPASRRDRPPMFSTLP